jgi:hypothetical protein
MLWPNESDQLMRRNVLDRNIFHKFFNYIL